MPFSWLHADFFEWRGLGSSLLQVCRLGAGFILLTCSWRNFEDGRDGESQRKIPEPRRRLHLPERHFASAPFKQAPLGKHEPPPPSPQLPPFPNTPPYRTSHPTLRLTAPGTGRLKCIFNSATLKWHSGKCTQSIINEIISL